MTVCVHSGEFPQRLLPGVTSELKGPLHPVFVCERKQPKMESTGQGKGERRGERGWRGNGGGVSQRQMAGCGQEEGGPMGRGRQPGRMWEGQGRRGWLVGGVFEHAHLRTPGVCVVKQQLQRV